MLYRVLNSLLEFKAIENEGSCIGNVSLEQPGNVIDICLSYISSRS